MFSEDEGRIPERQAACRRTWVVGCLVLPVDADWTTRQHLALWTAGILYSCLTTHSPVAALSTAGTLVRHPADQDPAVQEHFLERLQ